MFIDSARIFIKAGDGGNGAVSFHREKYVAAGGPDGGDGGKGGDVVFVMDEGARTLSDFRYKKHYKAESGKDGSSSKRSGKSGEDLVIKVPPGTLIKDEATGRILADIVNPGQREIVLRGGKGGKGNQHFATATRQVPSFAKSGGFGEEMFVNLELKLLADVGLIGFPNVGKSTILSVVSSAKPKIADYHFTTIEPNLGVVSLGEGNSFVIADIPGLINGAHEGVGLGHEFLKHIERTRALIHVVDISASEGRDPIKDFESINFELQKYNAELAERPQVIAANKIDIPEAENNIYEFKKEMESKGFRVFPVSAAINKGFKELMAHVFEIVKKVPDRIMMEQQQEEEVIYTTGQEKHFEINKENNTYVVSGNWIRKLVNSTNFGDYESLQYFQRTLKNNGIIHALENMGVREGDTVKLHDYEFEYVK